jgi:hypothetical protein
VDGPAWVEVVSDAPHVTSLNRHVREIRLPRPAANFDAMHSRLEIEGRHRRCRAVVLAINVDLASRELYPSLSVCPSHNPSSPATPAQPAINLSSWHETWIARYSASFLFFLF